MTLWIKTSAITCAIIVLISIANTKFKILHVVTNKFMKSLKCFCMNFISDEKLTIKEKLTGVIEWKGLFLHHLILVFWHMLHAFTNRHSYLTCFAWNSSFTLYEMFSMLLVVKLTMNCGMYEKLPALISLVLPIKY